VKIEKLEKGCLVERKTFETHIRLSVLNDGGGIFEGKTPSGFMDHMLNTFCKYSEISLIIEKCEGDTHVDLHHTLEDLGIVMGVAFKESFDYSKVQRFGSSTVPMDEALVSTHIDLSGRPYLNFKVDFNGAVPIGDLPVELVEEFFRAFTNNAKITLHTIKIEGRNSHHICEALFKSFAFSIKMATQPNLNNISSTKGMID